MPLVESCRTTQPASTQMEDAGITSKIKVKFIGDNDVKALDLGVATEEGIVYLTGRVENQFQKQEAERIARDTSGVKDVVNHIEVGDQTWSAGAHPAGWRSRVSSTGRAGRR